jgi:hypothetical protein
MDTRPDTAHRNAERARRLADWTNDIWLRRELLLIAAEYEEQATRSDSPDEAGHPD